MNGFLDKQKILSESPSDTRLTSFWIFMTWCRIFVVRFLNCSFSNNIYLKKSAINDALTHLEPSVQTRTHTCSHIYLDTGTLLYPPLLTYSSELVEFSF